MGRPGGTRGNRVLARRGRLISPPAIDRLEGFSADFADEVQRTLDGVLPGSRRIVSRRTDDSHRFVVQPDGGTAKERHIAIFVDGDHIADLRITLFLDLDRTGAYLKTVRSAMALYAVLDRAPLIRMEYEAGMRNAPIAHWQIHAERGSFSQMLARAHACRPKVVKKPHDLSSLHIPVGGERFRPCLEDFLQFLVVECGADAEPGWEDVLADSREQWRRRQLGSAVRDSPTDAARVLEELGWTLVAPTDLTGEPNRRALTQW